MVAMAGDAFVLARNLIEHHYQNVIVYQPISTLNLMKIKSTNNVFWVKSFILWIKFNLHMMLWLMAFLVSD